MMPIEELVKSVDIKLLSREVDERLSCKTDRRWDVSPALVMNEVRLINERMKMILKAADATRWWELSTEELERRLASVKL